jgi:hypothetical protein
MSAKQPWIKTEEPLQPLLNSYDLSMQLLVTFEPGEDADCAPPERGQRADRVSDVWRLRGAAGQLNL